MQRIQNAKRRLGVTTPKVVWQFIVFRHNEHEIAEAQAVHRAWGADEISIGAAIMPLDEHNDGLAPSSIARYNIYDPSHPARDEAARHMKSGKACSWLYGAIVINPGGNVSPCCGVASAQHDFGEFAPDKSFAELWNNDTFQRARRLDAKSAAKGTDDSGTWVYRLEGMAAKPADIAPATDLICRACPIPHLQNYATSVIDGLLLKMARSFMQTWSVVQLGRDVVHYVMMGAPLPSARALRSAARAAIRGLHGLIRPRSQWRAAERGPQRLPDVR